MSKIYKRHCDFCGEYYEGYGRMYCSNSCRMTERNLRDNPAKRPEVQLKLSEAAKGNRRCVGRVLSEQTRAKISRSLTGHKQSAETIAKKVTSWKETAAQYGGLTPAHRKQLESLCTSGPDHPNWKGGTTPERQANYFNNIRYGPFCRAVLERDDFTCQDCGQYARNLEVHHIIPYADDPELAFEVDNGLTLCHDCHKDRHRGVPRPGG